MKYEAINGIFKGRQFTGNLITISGEDRIWDYDSIGRSYPAENCKIVVDN